MPGLSCGIDFGTSNTLAAVHTADGLRICNVDPVNADPHLLPSLLFFSRYGEQHVGRAAMHAYQKDPDGRFVRALKSALPDTQPEERFGMFTRSFTLAGLARLLLQRVKECVEATAGGPVEHVTMGRPVRFSPDPSVDRRAEGILLEAAELAGFESVRFLSEPEAATRYYSAGSELPPRALVLVFDFGGGTLDLCLAETGESGYRVLNTGGTHIGGTLLDRILFETKILRHLGHGSTWGRGLSLPNSLYNRLVNPDANWRITESEYALHARSILDATTAAGAPASKLRAFHAVVEKRLGPDLFASIEAAKVRLSHAEETEIRFAAKDVEIVEPLSRGDLRVLFREQLGAIRSLILATLAEAGKRPEDVDRVLLAGGSSALVCTQELLCELFSPEQVPLRQDLFTSIVSGLALDAAKMPVAA